MCKEMENKKIAKRKTLSFGQNVNIVRKAVNFEENTENTNIMEKAVTFMGSMDITGKVTDVGNMDIMVRTVTFTENTDITENMDIMENMENMDSLS